MKLGWIEVSYGYGVKSVARIYVVKYENGHIIYKVESNGKSYRHKLKKDSIGVYFHTAMKFYIYKYNK